VTQKEEECPLTLSRRIIMISIKVPATSANLGPGFDCLGLALSLHNFIKIYKNVDKLTIENNGVNNITERNEDNLIYKSIKMLYDKVGEKVPPIRIVQDVNIPLSRGLGSSAACIVGGLTAANELLGKPVGKEKILELATEMEGHPDNVAPALFGGFVISTKTDGGVKYIRHAVNSTVKFVALVPNFPMSTKKARSVLPQTINYRDAVFNIGRSSLLTASLITGDLSCIKYAVEDKVHQPYRLGLIQDGEKIFKAAYSYGADAIFISGSGSTLMALTKNTDVVEKMRSFCKGLSAKWDVVPLDVDNEGVQVLK